MWKFWHEQPALGFSSLNIAHGYNEFMENFNTSNKKYRKIGPYLLIKPIGKGAYSTVYEAKKQNDGQRFAVKQISLVNVNPKQQERLHLEIKVLELIKHRNIVSLVDSKQTSRNLYLVFEYCKHTDLEAHVQKYTLGKLPEDKVRKIAIQIKNAFKVLRANKVVHRDLKLANILVTDKFDIKLADFGFAKLLDDDQLFKSYVGTPLTMAPEIMENRTYNEKCDLWSLGIVLYQLLMGVNPFFTKDRMTKTELKNAIRAELKIPSEISEEAADLLRRLIVRDPSQRIEFQQFFQHPWLTSEDNEENINEYLLEEALRVELGKCIYKTSRKKDEKDFVLRKGEDLLAYQLIEHVKNGIETRLMFWVNLGKKIMSFNYYNTKLTFLSLAIILDNIDQTLSSLVRVDINKVRRVDFPVYMKMRDLQKWEMSEYSKRLPDFLERSQKKMINHIKDLGLEKKFPAQAGNSKLVELYLSEILREVENSTSANEYLSTFLKVKPFEQTIIHLKLESSILSEKTLKLLLQKLSTDIPHHKMYKRCAQVYQLENLSRETPLDQVYEHIKLIFD